MTESSLENTAPSRRPRGVVGQGLAIVLTSTYVVAFMVRSHAGWPAWARTLPGCGQRLAESLSAGFIATATGKASTVELTAGLALLLTIGALPWLLMLLHGRGRPRDVGFNRPNRYAWRLFLLGFVIALPFIAWMVGGANYSKDYLSQLHRAGRASFIIFYTLNMLTEHFLLHGVVLSACHAGGSWPERAPIAPQRGTGLGRIASWLGLGARAEVDTGLRRVTRWWGLPAGCIPAILVSALLFGAVHLGKHPRELLLSFPGGMAQAYLAYRTNTWLTPFLLHFATASIAMIFMLMMA